MNGSVKISKDNIFLFSEDRIDQVLYTMEKYAFAFEKKLDGVYRRKLGANYIRIDARRTSYVSEKERDIIKKLLGSEVKIVWGISFSNALNRADKIEYTK